MHQLLNIWKQVWPKSIWSGITLLLTLIIGFAEKVSIYLRCKRPYLRFHQKGTDNQRYIIPGSIIYGNIKYASSMGAGRHRNPRRDYRLTTQPILPPHTAPSLTV